MPSSSSNNNTTPPTSCIFIIATLLNFYYKMISYIPEQYNASHSIGKPGNKWYFAPNIILFREITTSCFIILLRIIFISIIYKKTNEYLRIGKQGLHVIFAYPKLQGALWRNQKERYTFHLAGWQLALKDSNQTWKINLCT